MLIYLYEQKLIPPTVYLDACLKRQLQLIARAHRSKDAEVIREGLGAGLESIKTKQPLALEGLHNIAVAAKKNNIKGPKDLSVNHDKYLWDE